MIADRLDSLEVGETQTERFEFQGWVPLSQRLVSKRDGTEIPVDQLGYSAQGRVEAKPVDCGDGTKEECEGADGRIAICSSGWGSSGRFLHRIQKYRNASDAGAAAFILVGEPGHPAPLGMIRKGKTGKIPAVAVRFDDGAKILRRHNDVLTLDVRNRNPTMVSQNITWRKAGASPGIVLCAHCDSWGPGAWDNASGVSLLLHLAKRMARVDLKSELVICFSGGEEYGLLGTKEFCTKHGQEFAFAVNVDGVGLRGGQLQARCSDFRLSRIPPLKRVYSELPLTPWGDHWSFHRSGIRTVFITSNGISPMQHTGEDQPERLGQQELEAALNLVIKIVSYLDSIV